MLREIVAFAAVATVAVGCLEGAVDSSEFETFDQGLSICSTQAGMQPAKAALAVAMAGELESWKPLQYLEIINTDCSGVDGPHLRITAAGEAICARTGNCPNTKAILGMTDRRLRNVLDQTVFNPISFCEDLIASFNRQRDLLDDLTRNQKSMLPPSGYLLTRRDPAFPCGDGVCASPEDATNCPEDCVEACGRYYRYTAINLVGTTVNGVYYPPNIDNLIADLCFFGQNHPTRYCGGNDFMAFRSTTDLVYIDPQDGDLAGGTVAAANCMALNSPDINNGNPQNVGNCCSFPNPNRPGEMATGVIIPLPTQAYPNAQKCSMPAPKWYDPPSQKFVNLHCHYTNSTGLKTGRYVAWGTSSWDICNTSLQ